MHLSFVNNAKMDKAISMKFSVNELVSCMCLQMYFSYHCGPFFFLKETETFVMRNQTIT
jgi:hypothetical protein